MGDKLIVVKNNYKYLLFNGEYGKVLYVSPENEKRTIPLGKRHVDLLFRDVKILFKDDGDVPYELTCKLLENIFTESENKDILIDLQKALWVDFNIRFPYLRKNPKEFKNALLADPYFNALFVKWGYSVTCHKAQGGEWKTCLIDLQRAGGKNNNNYFRWLYTALTRAKENILLKNIPSINKYSYSEISELLEDAGFSNYKVIESKEYYKILNIIEDGKIVKIKFYLNKEETITKIEMIENGSNKDMMVEFRKKFKLLGGNAYES